METISVSQDGWCQTISYEATKVEVDSDSLFSLFEKALRTVFETGGRGNPEAWPQLLE